MNDPEYTTRGSARMGIVVPVSNTILEPDMMLLAPRGLSLNFARAGGYDLDRIPDQTQMQNYPDNTSDDLIESLRLCRHLAEPVYQGREFDRAGEL